MHGRIITLAMVSIAWTVACSKSASTPADTGGAAASAPAAAPAMDQKAEAAKITGADSAWLRAVMGKHVDSLMTWYTPDAVSYGYGPTAAGTDQIRAQYTEMVKSTITNPKLISNTVKFSDDGSMAYDHGTYSLTMAPPGGKPANTSGAYVNVWRKIDGQWKIVVEISTPLAAPKT
jgi:uncharacterized protein (TIGR02246 family)